MAPYVAEEARAGRGSSLEDLLVVNELFRERRVTRARAAPLLQLDERTAYALLNRMVDRGTLEARGEARGRTNHLSAGAIARWGTGCGTSALAGSSPSKKSR